MPPIRADRAGTYRGGLGVDMHFRMLEESYLTAAIEHTKTAPYGLAGGGEGRTNGGALRLADGSRAPVAKATRLAVPKGATFELSCGGGGGYGPPAARAVAAVQRDLREGYITEAHARRHYPHALDEADVRAAAE